MDITGIEYLGLDRVLKRGTGEVIEEHDHALFIRDSVSGAFLLACRDAALGAAILERHVDENCHSLMVSDYALGKAAYERYGFADLLECYQVACYGEPPAQTGGLIIRNGEEEDIPFLTEHYEYLDADEMRQIVQNRRILIGLEAGERVGFIGEHLEGSMGLLRILPQFRRRGYAEALEKALIAKTLQEGFVPFGQVEKSNQASLGLQRKLGMSVSQGLICWMWK